jgi:hypothetical protein
MREQIIMLLYISQRVIADLTFFCFFTGFFLQLDSFKKVMFLGINVFYIKKTIGTNEGVINNVIIFEPMHYSLFYFFNCF